MTVMTALRPIRLAAAAALASLAVACGGLPTEPRAAEGRAERVAADGAAGLRKSGGAENAQVGPTIPWF
jgi:hypothetical protein